MCIRPKSLIADGLKYIEFMKGKKLNSPRGPIEIDPETRDVIQNLYVREVRKVDGKLVNIDIAQEGIGVPGLGFLLCAPLHGGVGE